LTLTMASVRCGQTALLGLPPPQKVGYDEWFIA